MKEEVIQFGVEHNLLGILSQPEMNIKTTAILFLNAGFIYRAGPNRIHVELSRKLSQEGYYTFRFDFAGFGDSRMDSDKSTFEQYTVSNVIRAIDFLSENYNISNIVLFGICSGADVAFKTAIEDERVNACYFINGTFLNLSDLEKIYPLAQEKIKARYYKKNLYNPRKWIKLLSGKNSLLLFSKVLNIIQNTLKPNKPECQPNNSLSSDSLRCWKLLISKNTKLKLVYAEGSDTFDIFKMQHNELTQYIQSNHIEYELFNNTDHVFTPFWAQERLVNSFINWVNRNNN